MTSMDLIAIAYQYLEPWSLEDVLSGTVVHDTGAHVVIHMMPTIVELYHITVANYEMSVQYLDLL